MRSVGLLGDQVVKFLLGNDAISVGVGTIDHVLQDGVIGELSEILGHLPKVLECDEPSLLGIEGNEDLVDLIPGFVVRGSGGHHVEELGEFDLSTSVLVQLSDHLIDSLCLGLNSKRVNGNLELYARSSRTFGVNGASEISVEQVKGLFDLENLLKSDKGRDVIVRIEAHQSW